MGHYKSNVRDLEFTQSDRNSRPAVRARPEPAIK
jgi:hypothetical protein